MVNRLNTQNHSERLPDKSGLFSELNVGRTFSFADRDTKKVKGTIHRHNVKYAITFKKIITTLIYKLFKARNNVDYFLLNVSVNENAGERT
jgi:hypothetical protein